ncbi:MAG: hypothetical protein E2P03_10320 [Acidobacteria bacterium]|nr:MAG: hypothetical protein E2P03_10320 [Acidobacteriota bacterium]
MGFAFQSALLLLLGAMLLSPGQPVGAPAVQEDSPSEESPQEVVEPFDLGLQEEAGVTILILDVKVRDKQGRPVRGLTLNDFEVTINGRLWPLVAVDDFCGCNDSPGLNLPERAGGKKSMESGESSRAARDVTVEAGVDEISGAAAGGAAPPGISLPQHFILYLDFSELPHTGRVEAENRVRRWIEQAMQPEDRVMLAGFSTAAGLVEITPFTGDRALLLQGLEEAFDDKAFLDSFAILLPHRANVCDSCMRACLLRSAASDIIDPWPSCALGCCYAYARDQGIQGRRSLEALELFISTLGDIPGRKQVIYFNQNLGYAGMVLRKSMMAWSLQDPLRLLGEVAATATVNRTAITVATLQVGDAVTLGNMLAEFTGGNANQTMFDLHEVLDKAGRECCMYRLSVQVPDDPPRRTLRAKIAVQGRTLDLNYRVRFYTPQERWFRQARMALMTTSRSPDSQMQVVLLPAARHEGKWSVDAQVAFALQDLELVPRMEDRTGRWRVGALLDREDGHESWEMLTLARATLQGKGSTSLEALHSRTIENLKPGSYRLRAFVEDAELGRFWSREVTLELPVPAKKSGEKSWLSSPVVFRRIDGRLDLNLAPVTKKTPVSSVVGAPAAGFIPMNEADVVVGTILEFHSVLCPGPDDDAEPSTISVLVQDGRPLARLPAAAVEKAGECVTLTDRVDTSALAPGDYTYRLMLNRGDQEDPLLREVALTISAASRL